VTDQPYTDADLLHEAGRQHGELATSPDYMGVGEMMEDEEIPSTGQTWADAGLDDDAYDAAQRKIHDLIRRAADLGHWAVRLGADGLQPENDAALTIHAGDKPIARVLFAFAPDTPDDMRDELVAGLGQAIDEHL
jgi:hypothetical protein